MEIVAIDEVIRNIGDASISANELIRHFIDYSQRFMHPNEPETQYLNRNIFIHVILVAKICFFLKFHYFDYKMMLPKTMIRICVHKMISM